MYCGLRLISQDDMVQYLHRNYMQCSSQFIKRIQPASGYVTRQVSFVLNHYIYHENEEDTENPGLLIPRYKALGRTAPNGKVYSEKPLVSGSEDDLVPVRSIVTKNKGNLSVVTPDLICKKFASDFTDQAALGLSLATSLTEGIK